MSFRGSHTSILIAAPRPAAAASSAADDVLLASVPAPQRASIAAQLRALLDIKAALDPSGSALNWSEAAGAGAQYCFGAFEGVRCDAFANVQSIRLNGGTPLGGVLPPVAALLQLPKLEALDLAHTELHGTLPPEYALLTELQELTAAFNKQLAGPLPAAWAGMRSLRKLFLM